MLRINKKRRLLAAVSVGGWLAFCMIALPHHAGVPIWVRVLLICVGSIPFCLIDGVCLDERSRARSRQTRSRAPLGQQTDVTEGDTTTSAAKNSPPSNPRMQTDATVNGDGGDEGE